MIVWTIPDSGTLEKDWGLEYEGEYLLYTTRGFQIAEWDPDSGGWNQLLSGDFYGLEVHGTVIAYAKLEEPKEPRDG